jgi:tetratricopeptide (TPR) repeat protein
MKLVLKSLVLMVSCISTCQISFAEEKPWIEVRSPHFRVLTNGSEGSGRHVAREFELMRAVFASQFPGLRLEGNAPLTVIAPRGAEVARGLRLPNAIAGLYHHGWERDYAIVRLDAVTWDIRNPDTYAVVYHEYIHSLLHTNFRWIPRWLDEGLAEFYAYTRFEGDKMYIGAPPKNTRRIEVLDYRTTPPVAVFIEKSSSISRNMEDTQLFYAQAWSLTHFLTFGQGMGGGLRLKQFMNSLQRGVEQKKAFEAAIGPLDAVQKAYDLYLQHFAFTSGVIAAPQHLDEKDFAERTMSLAETEAELAAYAIRFHAWAPVHDFSQAAIEHDPKLSLGHEDLGFWYFNEGRDEEALKEFSKAVELDPKSYVALFAQTMVTAEPGRNDPSSASHLQDALLQVLELAPNFAPAYVQLAKTYIAQGDLTRALGLSRKAEQLEPFRSGYHLLSGEIELGLGRAGDAAITAAYVADRWAGSDKDEAIELWDRVPASQRPEGVHLLIDEAMTKPALPATVAEGIVKSVTCRERAFSITVDHAGESLTFRSEGFPVGFSDTLWVGEDHFSPCFHVSGLRAVVYFKPTSDKSYAGDLVTVGFRDDLRVNPVKGVAAGAGKSQ